MAFTSLFLDTSVGSTMTGMGDYISDLSKTIGVDLFEEDIDNVVKLALDKYGKIFV